MATDLRTPGSLARGARVAVPLLVVAAVVAMRPEIVTGTFSSATSVAKVVALVALWMAFSWLVRRFVHHVVARTAILATAGAGLLAVTVLPYFQEKTVDDPLPVASGPAVAATDATATATTTSDVVNIHVPAPTVPAGGGPLKLLTGQLRGLAGHRGAGEAVLYLQPDGSLLVRLEDFDVSSVPAPSSISCPVPTSSGRAA